MTQWNEKHGYWSKQVGIYNCAVHDDAWFIDVVDKRLSQEPIELYFGGVGEEFKQVNTVEAMNHIDKVLESKGYKLDYKE